MKKVYKIMLFMFLMSINYTFAATIYVDDDATGSDNGTSWANAYNSLQDALDAASSGDVIWVAKGTYYPETEAGGVGSRYRTFQMVEGVGIYGGFNGDEDFLTFDLDNRDFESNETILSGDFSENDDFDYSNGGYQGTTGSENSYHVFYLPNSLSLTSAAILDGFTIKGGNADGSIPHQEGGGLYIKENNPSLYNLIIKYNFATFAGGAVRIEDSSPTMINCVITNNTTNSYSAGLSINYSLSAPEFINCLIAYNYAINTTGGGVYVHSDADPVFKNCIIWGNFAGTSGNQFYVSLGSSVALNSTCYSNSVGDIENNGSFSPDINCITDDPNFADAANYDYRLDSDSPAKNTGENTYNSELIDVRGENRIQNTYIDMGPYEWTDGVDSDLVPVLITTNISILGDSKAQSGGNSINDNGYTITAKGVCWNTSGTPSLSDDFTDEGSDSTQYQSVMTGLQVNQQYYVRAYATNANGTGYGDEKIFIYTAIPTLPEWGLIIFGGLIAVFAVRKFLRS